MTGVVGVNLHMDLLNTQNGSVSLDYLDLFQCAALSDIVNSGCIGTHIIVLVVRRCMLRKHPTGTAAAFDLKSVMGLDRSKCACNMLVSRHEQRV